MIIESFRAEAKLILLSFNCIQKDTWDTIELDHVSLYLKTAFGMTHARIMLEIIELDPLNCGDARP